MLGRPTKDDSRTRAYCAFADGCSFLSSDISLYEKNRRFCVNKMFYYTNVRAISQPTYHHGITPVGTCCRNDVILPAM